MGLWGCLVGRPRETVTLSPMPKSRKWIFMRHSGEGSLTCSPLLCVASTCQNFHSSKRKTAAGQKTWGALKFLGSGG